MLLMFGIAPALVGADNYDKWGPRGAALVGACLWLVGSILAAVGVRQHSLPLLFIGHGVIGGTGLGLAYISPMPTLLRWFADRRAVIVAIVLLGLGGGSVFSSAVSEALLRWMQVGE
jgi:MFS family permease